MTTANLTADKTQRTAAADAELTLSAESPPTSRPAALPADLRTYLETRLNRLQGTDGLAVAAETAALKRWIALPTAEGSLVDEIKALPEYLAAKAAEEEYQTDSRSDDEIRTEAVDVAGGRRVCESLERLINGVGFAILGLTGQDDTRFAAWCDRYVATWAAEIIEWCDL